MSEQFTHPCKCLTCGEVNSGFAPMKAERPSPKPNQDITICRYCGTISIFNDELDLRAATEAEKDGYWESDRLQYAALEMASLQIKKGKKVTILSVDHSPKEIFKHNCTCQVCKHLLKDFLTPGIRNTPIPNKDLTLCPNCGTISFFDETFNLRPATEAELLVVQQKTPHSWELMMQDSEFIRTRGSLN